MKLTIDQEVLQKVVDYLVQQPFKDVAPLINQINQSVKPIENEPTATAQAD